MRAGANIYKNATMMKQETLGSKSFPVTNGLKKECCLSSTLFKIHIQSALNNWKRQVWNDAKNNKSIFFLFRGYQEWWEEHELNV